METFSASSNENWSDLARLIAVAPKEEFGRDALDFLSNVSRIENFGSYHIADLARASPTLSFWSGRISDYWFQRDAERILGSPDAQSRIIAHIHKAPLGGLYIVGAVRRMRTRIRLLVQPEPMRSIVGATQQERRHGLA